MTASRRSARLALWLAVLGASLFGLARAGAGPLGAPPLSAPHEWADWLGRRDGVTAAFALVRLVAMAAGWYLLAITVLGAVARATRMARLVRASDVLAVPFVRRLLHEGLGAGLAAATLVPAVVPLARASAAPSTATATATVTATATMHRLPDDPRPPVPATAPRPATPLQGTTWTVERGQHLWLIAERVVASALGRSPDDHEVAAYWQALVEANRRRLGDPDNPDLIYAGQLLTLPDPPAR